MKTAIEELIEYAEKILEHSTINAHLIIVKAKELQQRETKVKPNNGMLVCPFCGDVDFDKDGLRYHLDNYCNEFINDGN